MKNKLHYLQTMYHFTMEAYPKFNYLIKIKRVKNFGAYQLVPYP